VGCDDGGLDLKVWRSHPLRPAMLDTSPIKGEDKDMAIA